MNATWIAGAAANDFEIHMLLAYGSALLVLLILYDPEVAALPPSPITTAINAYYLVYYFFKPFYLVARKFCFFRFSARSRYRAKSHATSSYRSVPGL